MVIDRRSRDEQSYVAASSDTGNVCIELSNMNVNLSIDYMKNTSKDRVTVREQDCRTIAENMQSAEVSYRRR